MFSNEKGITIEKALFDKTCFIKWQSIETITYYNYNVQSDFAENYEGYKLYLNSIPIYSKHKKQWWLNKLFFKNSQSKIINIDKKTKHFAEIANMIQSYLNTNLDKNYKHPLKENLISTIEKCNQAINECEQIIFDKSNRTIEEIKKTTANNNS